MSELVLGQSVFIIVSQAGRKAFFEIIASPPKISGSLGPEQVSHPEIEVAFHLPYGAAAWIAASHGLQQIILACLPGEKADDNGGPGRIRIRGQERQSARQLPEIGIGLGRSAGSSERQIIKKVGIEV